MKIGISRSTEGEREAAELIRCARDCGFAGIQFKTSQLKWWDFDPQVLLRIDPNVRDVARAGVVFHPGGDYAKWEGPTRKVLDFVRTLGGEHACYCFGPSSGAEEAARLLTDTARRYAAVGASFSFHNHAGTIVGTLDEVRRMCDLLDPAACGLTFDTAHAAACGMDDLGHAARALASHVNNVHLKDVNDAGQFCPVGTGRLDLPGTIEALRAIGYDGWLVIDEESRDVTTPEACALSADFLRKQGLIG